MHTEAVPSPKGAPDPHSGQSRAGRGPGESEWEGRAPPRGGCAPPGGEPSVPGPSLRESGWLCRAQGSCSLGGTLIDDDAPASGLLRAGQGGDALHFVPLSAKAKF